MGFAIAGAVAVAGALNYTASENAASSEEGAANNASNTQNEQYLNNLALEQPYIQSGEANLNTLNSDMPSLDTPFSQSMYQQSPAYQAQLAAGLQAITRSSAARGTLGGGDTGKALVNYGTQAANADYEQAFNNYNTTNTNTYNRLAGLAGLGQTSTATGVQAGENAANNISANTIGAGNAAAAGTVGGANAISSSLNTGMSAWMQSQYLQALQNQNPNSGITMPQVGSQYGSTSSPYNLGANLPLSSLNTAPTY